MKFKNGIFLACVVIIGILLWLPSGCKKDDQDSDEPDYLEVTLHRMTYKHDLYYHLGHDERSIELEFSQPLDTQTVINNITLSDKFGNLDDQYDIKTSGRKILIMFHQGFSLQDGWKYILTISANLKSTTGKSLSQNKVFELRTKAKPLLPGNTIGGKAKTGISADSSQRNSIACISDIHMGDGRAMADKYCWFGKNTEALEDFLDYVQNGNQVRVLVILGDLFDEWLVPYTISPIDPGSGIHNSKEYFEAIANFESNYGVFEKLRAIALDPDIELVYVPGNHDMLMTSDILADIIPGITWAGGVAGLGQFSPLEEIIMEHGHRYDFFNCPQPLVNQGHILPPGYFISRLYAKGMMDNNSSFNKEDIATDGSFEFIAAWDIAFLYTILHFNMTIPTLDSSNILMGGIDDYQDPFSFNGVVDMYAVNIEDNWPQTQTANAVPVQTACCLDAIWNGHSDLFGAAITEYMAQPPAPKKYKVVTFGHTHEPMLAVHPPGKHYSSIYANTGSWIDADASSHKVRTFIVINPAAWTGSDLDVVMLYQYNLNSNTGNPDPSYAPVLISEENIEAGR